MTDRPTSPLPRRSWSAAWTGVIGVAALLGLVLASRAEPAAGLVAAAALALVTTWQSVRADRIYRAAARRLDRMGADLLETSSAPFEDAFEQMPDPALLVVGGEPDDLASRRVLAANAAARELLRIPREGALLVSALRHPEVLEAVDESLFGGMTRVSSWSSGGVQDRVWRAWSAPSPTGADEAPQALLIMHEETDVRRAERTRADFLANASHELRTPLASLAGFVETLRGHARHDDDARERFLSIMAAQAERMARLVDDILSLSRVELNEHVPPSGAVDLSQAVRDVCDALAPLARKKGVTLEPAPGERVLIVGDRDGVVQVVQNLVDNGLNYSAPGTTVRVTLATDLSADEAGRPTTASAASLALLTPDRAPDQRYAAVRVSDSGPGIEREHLPRLTERFYRVAGQKSGERPGTGLGLAIVRHIVNRHRGGLSVDSTPGEGSTFTAWFPLASAAERGETPAPRPTVAATKVS